MDLTSSPRSRKAIDRAVRVGMGAIVVLSAYDEATRLTRRSKRSMNTWMDGVDHRQLRAWRRGQVAFLIRLMRVG